MTSLGKIAALVVLLCASSASAQDRLQTLDRELEHYAQQGRKERIGNGILAVALGATLIPAGIVMARRDEDTVRLIGIGTTVTGAVQLLRLPEFIFPSDMERMRTRHLQRKAQGLSGDALLTETERDWREKAATEDRVQRFIGAFNLGIGVVAIPIGLTFMLRDEIGDMSHRKQQNVGSTMLGIGVGYIAAASVLLFSDGPTERSWKSHSIAFGLTPIAQGASLSASGRF